MSDQEVVHPSKGNMLNYGNRMMASKEYNLNINLKLELTPKRMKLIEAQLNELGYYEQQYMTWLLK